MLPKYDVSCRAKQRGVLSAITVEVANHFNFNGARERSETFSLLPRGTEKVLLTGDECFSWSGLSWQKRTKISGTHLRSTFTGEEAAIAQRRMTLTTGVCR